MRLQLIFQGKVSQLDNSQAHYHRAKDVLVKPFSAPFLKYIWAGIVVGLVTGLVVSVFRWIIDQTLRLLTIVYPFLGHHPLWLLPYVLGTILVSWLIGRLSRPTLPTWWALEFHRLRPFCVANTG